MKTLPLISVVIPTFNEEKNIDRCLQSIFNQSYPKNRLEVFVADDNSTDNTLTIAKKYPVKIINHASKDPEVGKLITFHKSKGDLFLYLDADIHLKGNGWFEKMVKPLTDNPLIAASFTRYCSDEHSANIERYLNLDPLQRDAVYKYFSPDIEELIVESKEGYYICKYRIGKIPPSGLCMHRRKLIEKFLIKQKRFLELDLLVDLVEEKKDFFAYVPEAGLYHHHATTFFSLLRKRGRNVTNVYLKDNEARKYRWFDLQSATGVANVIGWVIWVHLFIPALMMAVFDMIRYRSWVAIYGPFVSLFATDVIIYSFLKDKRGRRILNKNK